MAQNYINKGINFTLTIPSATIITPGQLVTVGGAADDKMVGVALGAGIAGQEVEVAHCGVWVVKKKAAQAFVQGQKLYANADGEATTDTDDGAGTPVNHPVLGYAWKAATSAAVEAEVKLLG
jgi:predicted RecA/RadA family phage recombinase